MRSFANYDDCGFAVLRSPALPVGRLLDAEHEFALPDGAPEPEQYDALRNGMALYLSGLVRDPTVREALWVASPGLVRRLDEKQEAGGVARDTDMVLTLYKYCVRMATRCTPFGLFAKFTVGRIAERSTLDTAVTPCPVRATRLDAEFVYRLVAHLNDDRAVRTALRYRVNTSLYRVGMHLHYAETTVTAGRGVSYSLSGAAITDYLLDVVEHAVEPTAFGALVDAVCANVGGVDRDEAADFIHELIDNQVLVSELTPAVTGESLLRTLIRRLHGVGPARNVLDRLERVADAIACLDAGEAAPEDYGRVVDVLRELPVEINEQHLFQVDAARQFDAAIGQDVLDEIRRSVDFLNRIAPPLYDELDDFKRRFSERYEEREVPLCEVLDADAGIGFDGRDTNAAALEPLLKGIRGFHEVSDPSGVNLSARDVVLAGVIQHLEPGPNVELELDAELATKLEGRVKSSLPDAWSAFIVLLGEPDTVRRDAPLMYLKSASGPGAANLLGRFCHVSSELESAVRKCCAAEAALQPDAVLAEVAYMPQGRIGNVLRRPRLRGHEIVYLCESHATGDDRIRVQDLLVSVRDGRVVLRSRRTGKRVLPRLASAHNFQHDDNLGMYRFLCSLQYQGVRAGLMWDWGGLDLLDFLPRVRFRRAILARASWRLRADDVKKITSSYGVKRYRAVRDIRDRLHLPSTVLVEEGDNDLQVDLDNPLSLDLLADFLRRYKTGIRVQEVLPSSLGTPFRIRGEAYRNELIVPFVRRANT